MQHPERKVTKWVKLMQGIVRNGKYVSDDRG